MDIRQHLKIGEARQRAADRLARAADKAKAAAAAEWQSIWDQMDDEGWERGDDTKLLGTRYGKQVTYYGNVSDPIVFKRWAAEAMPSLIQPQPRKQLINEEVQRRMDAGEEMPPGIVAFPKRRVSRRAV